MDNTQTETTTKSTRTRFYTMRDIAYHLHKWGEMV